MLTSFDVHPQVSHVPDPFFFLLHCSCHRLSLSLSYPGVKKERTEGKEQNVRAGTLPHKNCSSPLAGSNLPNAVYQLNQSYNCNYLFLVSCKNRSEQTHQRN